jgi:hypothetical protein
MLESGMKNFACLLLCVFSLSSHADTTVRFDDDITSRSMNSLLSKISKALEKDSVVTVELSSGGGEIGAALDFVNRAQRMNGTVNTLVNSSCESACTILFTAGLERLASSSAQFGFHAPEIASRVPRGVSREEVLQRAKDRWMEAIGRVDGRAVYLIESRGMLDNESMSYLRARDLTSGYVTRIIR